MICFFWFLLTCVLVVISQLFPPHSLCVCSLVQCFLICSPPDYCFCSPWLSDLIRFFLFSLLFLQFPFALPLYCQHFVTCLVVSCYLDFLDFSFSSRLVFLTCLPWCLEFGLFFAKDKWQMTKNNQTKKNKKTRNMKKIINLRQILKFCAGLSLCTPIDCSSFKC